MTGWSARGRRAGPPGCSRTARWWCCPAPGTLPRWSGQPPSRPRSTCCSREFPPSSVGWLCLESTARMEITVSLPPLVEPAESLSVDEVKRYSRHLIIPDVGMTGQKRLKNAKVLCVGAGGLGSPALLYLAAAGVGTLGIIDFDVVDESNLQRQIIHGMSDIGRSKAESARDSILELNPLTNVVLHETALDSDNALDIFAPYDL